MKRLTGLVICSGLIWSSCAWGTELPSLERGAQLFASEQLGTSGKSCASCHPGGSRLEETGATGDKELVVIINNCITGPLKGKALDPESADMKSLLLYLRSLTGSGKKPY